jgi:hypothetical protein
LLAVRRSPISESYLSARGNDSLEVLLQAWREDSARHHLPVAQHGGMQRSDRAIGACPHVHGDGMGVKIWIPKHPAVGMFGRAALAVLEQRGRQGDLLDARTVLAPASEDGFLLDRCEDGADGALRAASRLCRRSSFAKAHASDTVHGAETSGRRRECGDQPCRPNWW